MSHELTSEGRCPFDCMVLSGGGAKGAFGAGAARAVLSYREMRGRNSSDVCFLGTSAGALNATILAAWGNDGPRRLHALWSSVDAKTLLGAVPGRFKTLSRLVRRALTHGENFSIYDADGLKGIITQALMGLDFSEFQRLAHLVIVAADYTEGRLTRFYSSSLIDELVAKDLVQAKSDGVRPKLNRFKRITSTGMLIDCLLASAAIPLMFPLVQVDGHWFADGGIGDNTPVQEAALLMRTLNEWSGDLRAGDTFCVLQHPSRTAARVDKRGLWGIAATTYELVHHLHMGPILGSWNQINASLEEHDKNVNEFLDAVSQMAISEGDKESLRKLSQAHLSRLGGHAPRLVLPLYEIRPSGDLGGLLEFDAPQEHDEEGYTAAVDTLSSRGLIQPYEAEQLQANLLTDTGPNEFQEITGQKPPEQMG